VHAHFIASGETRRPVRYAVTTVQETRRFLIRRVEATQDAKTLALATFTFHEPETSEEHTLTAPPVQRPEVCPTIDLSTFGGPSPAFGPVLARIPLEVATPAAGQPANPPAASVPSLRLWLRGRGRVSADPLLNAAALLWLSDLTMTRTVDLPRQRLDGLPQRISLNHAVWFHRAVNAQEWLLADQYSDIYAGGRGVATARYFDRSGSLQATATQECVIRRPSVQASSHSMP